MAELSEFKTEIIGISAEVAIADVYNLPLNPNYRQRANEQIVAVTRKLIPTVFAGEKIPNPRAHIAEGQNPIDFLLEEDASLSVKTNQRKLGKTAPQNIGQPTASTYWDYFADLADGPVPEDYKGRSAMFKRVTIDRIDEIMVRYWENLFDCDYLLHLYDYLDKFGEVNPQPAYAVFRKSDSPRWEKQLFSFTQNPGSWNESNTVKYADRSIGEFQVHNNRDCFKFRFNMAGIAGLMSDGLI